MALELGAILRAFDPDSSIRKSGLEGGDLNRFMGAAVNRDELRRRAAWASGILAIRSGNRERLAAARRVLADELPPRALSRIIDAADRGGADPASGLALLPQLPALERGAPVPDPAADAVVRLLRAEWLARIGRLEEARRGLRWHEHLEAPRHGTGDPQPGEIAWALGGLVSWLRAGLLARMVEDGGSVAARDERCAVNRRVAQFWETAPTPFRERAARARLAMGAGECRST